jgi:hypothetical protein
MLWLLCYKPTPGVECRCAFPQEIVLLVNSCNRRQLPRHVTEDLVGNNCVAAGSREPRDARAPQIVQSPRHHGFGFQVGLLSGCAARPSDAGVEFQFGFADARDWRAAVGREHVVAATDPRNGPENFPCSLRQVHDMGLAVLHARAGDRPPAQIVGELRPPHFSDFAPSLQRQQGEPEELARQGEASVPALVQTSLISASFSTRFRAAEPAGTGKPWKGLLGTLPRFSAHPKAARP